jgi:hypothetical protein
VPGHNAHLQEAAGPQQVPLVVAAEVQGLGVVQGLQEQNRGAGFHSQLQPLAVLVVGGWETAVTAAPPPMDEVCVHTEKCFLRVANISISIILLCA